MNDFYHCHASKQEYELVVKAVRMIRHKGESSVEDLGDILEKVGERLNALLIHQ